MAAHGRLKSGRLAGLGLTAAIITVSWPVLVDSFLNSLVGLTDTAIAAAISPGATDAIGNAAYTLWFVGLLIRLPIRLLSIIIYQAEAAEISHLA